MKYVRWSFFYRYPYNVIISSGLKTSPYIPGGIEMGGGLINGPPMSGGPGIIWCLMGAIMGPPIVMLMGGPVTLTGNLCIMAACWFMASTCFCWWAAACWAADTAVANWKIKREIRFDAESHNAYRISHLRCHTSKSRLF